MLSKHVRPKTMLFDGINGVFVPIDNNRHAKILIYSNMKILPFIFFPHPFCDYLCKHEIHI